MGAPGCPELLAKVASTYRRERVSDGVLLTWLLKPLASHRGQALKLSSSTDGGAATKRAIFGGAEASHDDDEGQSSDM
jgi:hypothetical protein